LEEVTVIGAARRGRTARLQLDWSDAVFDPNQIIRPSAEAIAFGYERSGLWKGAADVRVENVWRREAGSREQSAPHEPCQGRGDEGNEEEHRLRSISASVGPEPIGRSKHHDNEQSASCAIRYAPGLIHTASMLLMIVNAGVPLLNLHEAGADAAGAQIPGSSAKTPFCDFRSANEITIEHIDLGRHARPD
jgi:hypothetical protein